MIVSYGKLSEFHKIQYSVRFYSFIQKKDVVATIGSKYQGKANVLNNFPSDFGNHFVISLGQRKLMNKYRNLWKIKFNKRLLYWVSWI